MPRVEGQASPHTTGLPPAVVVHGLAHARMALGPGRPVLLLSARAAAGYAGASWWRALITIARDGSGIHAPDALDCSDQAGRALEALAVGCAIIVLHPCPAFPAIVERAAGALVLPARPPAFDLAKLNLRRPGALQRLDAWLQGDSAACIG